MKNLKNINFAELEELRDEKELRSYFEEKSVDITAKDILQLKEIFNKVKTYSNCLTLQQLDGVAGGILLEERVHSWFRENKEKFYSNPTERKGFQSTFSQIIKRPGTVPLMKEQITLEPHKSTKTTTTTTPQIDLKSHSPQGTVEQRQQKQEHFTFYEHSFLSFGLGKEVTIEDSHVRALFTPTKEVDQSTPEHSTRKNMTHVVDMQNPDVKALVNKYASEKIAELYRSIVEANNHKFGTYTEQLVQQYQTKIEHFKAMKDGKIDLTHDNLIYMFNEIHHKDGLAESLIHIAASQFSENFNEQEVYVEHINAQSFLHVKDIINRDVFFHLECNNLEIAPKHIAPIIADPNVPINSIMNFSGKEFTKIADNAFSYVDSDGHTVVMNTEDEWLFSVKNGRIYGCGGDREEAAAQFILGQLSKIAPGKTKKIAGATFTKIADNAFSYVDTDGDTVVMNSDGKCLFRVRNGQIYWHKGTEEAAAQFILGQLSKIAPGKTKKIAGAIFTKEGTYNGNVVFSYVARDECTVVMNSDGNCLFGVREGRIYWYERNKEAAAQFIAEQLKEVECGETKKIAGVRFTKIADNAFSYVDRNGYTEVMNSDGKCLFRVRNGQIYWHEGTEEAAAQFIAKQLSEIAPGETKDIAGAIFTKIANNAFSYVDSDGYTEVMNSDGNCLFRVRNGQIYWHEGTEEAAAQFIAEQLKEVECGETKKIAGVRFTKIADNAFSYVDTDGDTVVMNSEGKCLFRVRNGQIYWHEGTEEAAAQFIAKQLSEIAPGETKDIAGAIFTKIANNAFSYVNRYNFPVVRNTKGKRLFWVREGRIYWHEWNKETVAQLITEQLKDKGEITIAGVTFIKVANNAFGYFDGWQKKEFVIRNAKGEIVFEFKEPIKCVENMDNEEFTTIKGIQGEILVKNSKGEVLVYFNEYGKVGYFNINWVNAKLSDPSKITGEEREIITKILRGLFKPNITDKAIELLRDLGYGKQPSIVEIAHEIGDDKQPSIVDEIAREIGFAYYSRMRNVYIDDNGIIHANGDKYGKAEIRETGDGLRRLRFLDEIIEEKPQPEAKTSEQPAGEINYEELRTKLTEIEAKIEEKK